MSVDPYSLCPCGSGKKLKFCCSDLATEIEKVHRMLEGDQPRAALAHLTQTLAKSPRRGSLLDLKATIEMSLGEADEARATVERFIEADPKNPSAHAQQAILLSSLRGDPEATPGRDAVDALQTALELIEEEMPARVLQAIGAVGQALLVEGNLVAARAHLWLYQGIAGREDTRAMELLARLNQVSGLPLLLRDHLYLRELPAGSPAEALHDEAQMFASRGQWRRAADQIGKLRERHPDLPQLAYNHALVGGWLGDIDRFVEGLRFFAEATFSDGEADDAIEAEAIAQLLDRERREPPIDVVRTTYAVADEDALIDRLTRDKRTDNQTLSPEELQALEGPPPRLTMVLLDRPLPDAQDDLTADTTPRIVGFLSYYGRQTDQPERLELVCDRDERFDSTRELLREVAGDALGEQRDETAVGEAAATEPTLRVRWRFPEGAPPVQQREIMASERRRALLDDWPQRSKTLLGGKTPQDAAGDASLSLALAGALLVLEQASDGRIGADVFVELREKLGLTPPDAIDPSGVEIELLPLVRIVRVDLSQVSDEGLVSLYERAILAGANDAVLAIARVGVDRPGVVEHLPDDELYYRLVSFEPDPAAARAWVVRAREAAEAAGRSSATWDILELEICVINGELDEANRLVKHVRDEHLNEPGVAEQLYHLLYSLGAVPAPGAGPGNPAAPLQPTAPPVAEAEGGGSQLWTPDNPGPASPGDGPKQGESKIWTPS